MDEYINKQRAKDLMGCCLTSAKANYKAETSVFKKEQFKHYAETIEAMIDVVGAVEAADVQPIRHGRWDFQGYQLFKCTNCKEMFTQDQLEAMQNHKDCEECAFPNFCPNCGARMDGEQDD